MPLRDHFHPPLDNKRSWEELHGGWPMMLVAALSKKLPPRYVAGPRVRSRDLRRQFRRHAFDHHEAARFYRAAVYFRHRRCYNRRGLR